MGKKRTTYESFVGKQGRKRPVGIHRHTWYDNIKSDFRERV
jgi:hypothetical protein